VSTAFTDRSLGAFVNLRKANISLVMTVRLFVRPSVRPSVRIEQVGSHWTDFVSPMFFLNFVQKIEV